MDKDQLKRFIECPPQAFGPLAFRYRQAIGIRQQCEQRIQAAQQDLARAQRVLAQAQADLQQATGYEKGLREAIDAVEPLLRPPDPPRETAEGGVE